MTSSERALNGFIKSHAAPYISSLISIIIIIIIIIVIIITIFLNNYYYYYYCFYFLLLLLLSLLLSRAVVAKFGIAHLVRQIQCFWPKRLPSYVGTKAVSTSLFV